MFSAKRKQKAVEPEVYRYKGSFSKNMTSQQFRGMKYGLTKRVERKENGVNHVQYNLRNKMQQVNDIDSQKCFPNTICK